MALGIWCCRVLGGCDERDTPVSRSREVGMSCQGTTPHYHGLLDQAGFVQGHTPGRAGFRTFHQKLNLSHAIDFKGLSGTNLVA